MKTGIIETATNSLAKLHFGPVTPRPISHGVSEWLKSIADNVVDVKDPERNEWVAQHLLAISGTDPSSTTITMEQFKKGLEGMGMNEDAVKAMLRLGTPPQGLSSGEDLYTSINLKNAGRNHAGAPSNVIRSDGGISKEGMKYLLGFATTQHPETKQWGFDLDAISHFMENRKNQIMAAAQGIPDAVKKFVGSRVIMEGEFGPFITVAGVPLPDGSLWVSQQRMAELYNHKIFYRVRAERDAAQLLIDGMDQKIDGGKKFKAPEALATFAKMEGADVSTKENALAFATKVLQQRDPGAFAVKGKEVAAARSVVAQLGPEFEAVTGQRPDLGWEADQAHAKAKVSKSLVDLAADPGILPQSGADLALAGANLLIDNPSRDYLSKVLDQRTLGTLTKATVGLMCPWIGQHKDSLEIGPEGKAKS